MLLDILRAVIDIVDNAAELLGVTQNFKKYPRKKPYKPENKTKPRYRRK
jgi:hypothetical protein